MSLPCLEVKSVSSDHYHHSRFVKEEDSGHSCLVFWAGSGVNAMVDAGMIRK